jgi:hypothetical protein
MECLSASLSFPPLKPSIGGQRLLSAIFPNPIPKRGLKFKSWSDKLHQTGSGRSVRGGLPSIPTHYLQVDIPVRKARLRKSANPRRIRLSIFWGSISFLVEKNWQRRRLNFQKKVDDRDEFGEARDW